MNTADRGAHILHEHTVEGRTLKAIGVELGISGNRARQILQAHIEREAWARSWRRDLTVRAGRSLEQEMYHYVPESRALFAGDATAAQIAALVPKLDLKLLSKTQNVGKKTVAEIVAWARANGAELPL